MFWVRSHYGRVRFVSIVMKHLAGALGLWTAFAALGCSSASIELPSGTGGTGLGGGSPQGGAGSGGTSGPPVTIDLDAAVVAQPDLASSEPLPDLTGYQCDEVGNCTKCDPVRILSLGQPAQYGANSGTTDSTQDFQLFMKDNTNGTATMTMQESPVSITADLLSNYDVVILQGLYTNVYDPNGIWKFTSTDATALHDWVNDKGGALIAMSGYFSDNSVEIGPLNQLMAPFGITYDADTTFTQSDCPNPPGLCYCAYGSYPFDNWTTAVPDITKNLGKVGVFMARSITCPGADCQVVAIDNVDASAVTKNLGVAKQVGNGRVFAWGDEWVTYTSQWGLKPDPTYDDASTYQQCVGFTPHTSYTVPQFWYNVFRWVAHTSCLTIIVPPTAGSVPQIVY